MELDKNTFFIFNKLYEHAKLAQWGTGGRDVGTYEQSICPDQLWVLEKSSASDGCYYIKNAYREGYRLAKWGSGDGESGVFNGQYYEDQLWKFQREGDYYRIYNKKYPSAKIAKWGKDDGDWGTYAGPDYDDQLWKLVPRFKAAAGEYEIWHCDNRQGTTDVAKEFEVATGVKLTSSQTLTTKIGIEYSLKFSLLAGIEGILAGMESLLKLSTQLESNISRSEEKFWSKETTTKYTAPAGKNYRVVQTLVHFVSPLDSDNCCLYCQERIEETD